MSADISGMKTCKQLILLLTLVWWSVYVYSVMYLLYNYQDIKLKKIRQLFFFSRIHFRYLKYSFVEMKYTIDMLIYEAYRVLKINCNV